VTREQLVERLVAEAAARYRPAGLFAFFFARGKLRGDPVFAALLARGLIDDRATVLDLGCGQGLLCAWLDAARACHGRGEWHDAWPAPPGLRNYRGIDQSAREVARASVALGSRATIERGDIRTADYRSADVIVMLDVLHYLDPPNQDRILARVRAALRPAGTLLLRVGDAGAGLGFRVGQLIDRLARLCRGHGAGRLHGRTLAQWSSALERAGFASFPTPMSAGTPFANVLIVAMPR
jgi:SAM-dependent methyltransferase